MPKVSNKDIYAQDPSLDMEDYLLGTNNNTTNKKTQTYSLGSIFSLFYNFLGYNAFLFTTDTDTYPIASPGCFFAFDEDNEITSDFQQARKLTFSSNDTYNFNVTEYLQMLVDSDKFLFKLINLEDKNNFIFLKPRNFTLSNTLTSFDVNIEIQYGLSNGNFVNYKKYLLLLEFDANTFDPADYDLTDFTNTSGNPFVTSQDLTNALSLLPAPITNHSGLNLDDGTNPHGTTKSDLDLENVPNIDATNRANHTGTQLSTTISDLQETIEDTIGTKVKAGTNVSVSYDDTTGETTISSTDNGEVNTASNIGTAGVGVFKQKTGENLEFKKINSGSNKVIITDDVVNNEVDINVVEANFTGIPQSAVTNLTTDISNKLDKSTTPSSVYGTNASGNQTMIPVDEFVEAADFTNHLNNNSNPHNVTKSQIGLGNVDNTSDLNKPISTATQLALDGKQNLLTYTPEDVANKTNTTLDLSVIKYPTNRLVKTYVDDGLATKQPTLVSGTSIKTLEGQSLLGSGNIDLTKNDVGLSNVDNTSDIDKPISTATQQALDLKANASDLGDVAVSNDYNDLDNLPTIPNNLEELHNVTETNYTTPINTDSVLTFDVTNSLWKRLSWVNIKSNLKTYFDKLYVSLSIFNDFVTDVFDSLDNKLDKSSTPSSVYTTDSAGLQVMKPISEFQTDISGKLDKVTTSGVERVYIINPDGSQATKPTSEFGSENNINFKSFNSVFLKENPIIIPEPGNAVREIGNIIFDESLNVFLMVYSENSLPYNEINVNVYLATSLDGFNWDKKGVIIDTPSEDPVIIKHNDVYYIYCEKKINTGSKHAGIELFTTNDILYTAPISQGIVLDKGSFGEWDSMDASSPTKPVFVNGKWQMVFEGRADTTTGFSSSQLGALGIAYSTDLINWTKEVSNPIKSGYQFYDNTNGMIDWCTHLVPDDVFFYDGEYYLSAHVYNGKDFTLGVFKINFQTLDVIDFKIGSIPIYGKDSNNRAGAGNMFIQINEKFYVTHEYLGSMYLGEFSTLKINESVYQSRIGSSDYDKYLLSGNKNTIFELNPSASSTYVIPYESKIASGVLKKIVNKSKFDLNIGVFNGSKINGLTDSITLYSNSTIELVSNEDNDWIVLHETTDSVKQKTITTSRTALTSDNGKLIKIKGDATYTIDQATLPTGWNVIVRSFTGATCTFVASAGTTFDAPNGLILKPLKMCSIIKDSDDNKILINGETSLT